MENILTLKGLRLDLDSLRKLTKTPGNLVLTVPPVVRRKNQINYNQTCITEPLIFGKPVKRIKRNLK
jgi:hypothetical protein